MLSTFYVASYTCLSSEAFLHGAARGSNSLGRLLPRTGRIQAAKDFLHMFDALHEGLYISGTEVNFLSNGQLPHAIPLAKHRSRNSFPRNGRAYAALCFSQKRS